MRKKNLEKNLQVIDVCVYNEHLVNFLYQIAQILKLKQVIVTFINKTLKGFKTARPFQGGLSSVSS